MKRRGNLALAPALLAALLLVPAARAADPEKQKPTLQQLVEELRKEVDSLKELSKQQSATIKAMDGNLRAMGGGVQKDVADLRKDAEDLRKDIDELKRITRRLTVTPRTSASFTPAPLATGTLRLNNSLGVTATVYVDGVPYSIPPYTVRTLPARPAGTLVYEATAEGRGMGPAVRSSLAANETLTVTVY
jgi:hypothetical protein